MPGCRLRLYKKQCHLRNYIDFKKSWLRNRSASLIKHNMILSILVMVKECPPQNAPGSGIFAIEFIRVPAVYDRRSLSFWYKINQQKTFLPYFPTGSFAYCHNSKGLCFVALHLFLASPVHHHIVLHAKGNMFANLNFDQDSSLLFENLRCITCPKTGLFSWKVLLPLKCCNCSWSF